LRHGSAPPQLCVSEFLAFLTSEVADKVAAGKRKLVTGDDLIAALEALGFEDYVGPLTAYLAKYREATAKGGAGAAGGGGGRGGAGAGAAAADG
jgi:nuclear transcription Y subunit beta